MRLELILEDAEGPVTLAHEFARPKPVHLDRLTKRVSESPWKANRDLLMDLVAEGDRDDLGREIEEYPGIVMALSGKLLEMAGATSTVIRKN
jgi:hypothetical protein